MRDSEQSEKKAENQSPLGKWDKEYLESTISVHPNFCLCTLSDGPQDYHRMKGPGSGMSEMNGDPGHVGHVGECVKARIYEQIETSGPSVGRGREQGSVCDFAPSRWRFNSSRGVFLVYYFYTSYYTGIRR
jgi:hypothetical protein